MFIYPHNLKAKAKIGLWELKDLCILVFAVIFSVMILVQTGFLVPLVISATYGILSIKAEDISILNFMSDAFFYFLLKQQIYDWEC
ncbi:MAG: hypothetical protein R3Y35_11665 [Clostridia bacterium]